MNMKKISKTIGILLIAIVCISAAAVSVAAESSYIRGDADGDRNVDIRDVTAIQRHLAELESLNNNQIRAADVNGGGLDISDATAIQMYLAEYIDPYQIDKTFTYDDYELPFISQ